MTPYNTLQKETNNFWLASLNLYFSFWGYPRNMIYVTALIYWIGYYIYYWIFWWISWHLNSSTLHPVMMILFKNIGISFSFRLKFSVYIIPRSEATDHRYRWVFLVYLCHIGCTIMVPFSSVGHSRNLQNKICNCVYS